MTYQEFEQELAQARTDVLVALDAIERVPEIRRGAELVRAWIVTEGFERAWLAVRPPQG